MDLLGRRRSMTLDKLGLPARPRNALRRGEILTMGELTAMSADHLLVLRGMGAASIEHIETALQSCGLALEPSPYSTPPPWVSAATIECRERVQRRLDATELHRLLVQRQRLSRAYQSLGGEACPECGL